jgi:hypothetical protein
VRSNAINNHLVPFRDFSDIETYLRQQWAGMMFSFLLQKNEDARVADMLGMLKDINERVEMLSRQILESVGTKTAKLTAALYDKMLRNACIRDMEFMGAHHTPKDLLKYDTFDVCFEHTSDKEIEIEDNEEDSYSVGSDGSISHSRLDSNRKSYKKLHLELSDFITTNYGSVSQYLADED